MITNHTENSDLLNVPCVKIFYNSHWVINSVISLSGFLPPKRYKHHNMYINPPLTKFELQEQFADIKALNKEEFLNDTFFPMVSYNKAWFNNVCCCHGKGVYLLK